MPTCNNMIPTSFLLWLKLGEERGQEAVSTSIFPQSNLSLTSHQSAVLSPCPCSFFSCSVTRVRWFICKDFSVKRQACLSPTDNSLFALYLSLLVVCTKEALAV